MKDISDINFIIQARLGSQRVPNKMIKPFAGTTLLDIAIEKVLNSKRIPKDRFHLSVYEEELKEIGKKYNINIFHRSKQSADEEHDLKVIYEWHNKLKGKYVILINACCPFLKVETIDAFIREYLLTPHRGLFGVVGKKNYFWDEKGNLITKHNGKIMNTKVVGTTYEGAHCLYASKLFSIPDDVWMGEFKRKDPVLFEVPEPEALDIDYPWQWNMCEILFKSEFGSCI